MDVNAADFLLNRYNHKLRERILLAL